MTFGTQTLRAWPGLAGLLAATLGVFAQTNPFSEAKTLAESGDAQSQFMLGEMFAKGQGTKQNGVHDGEN